MLIRSLLWIFCRSNEYQFSLNWLVYEYANDETIYGIMTGIQDLSIFDYRLCYKKWAPSQSYISLSLYFRMVIVTNPAQLVILDIKTDQRGRYTTLVLELLKGGLRCRNLAPTLNNQTLAQINNHQSRNRWPTVRTRSRLVLNSRAAVKLSSKKTNQKVLPKPQQSSMIYSGRTLYFETMHKCKRAIWNSLQWLGKFCCPLLKSCFKSMPNTILDQHQISSVLVGC